MKNQGFAAKLMGAGLLAMIYGFSAVPVAAQDDVDIVDFGETEEVTAIHESGGDDSSDDYAYVFYDEYMGWLGPLGPHIPPSPPDPVDDPCAEALRQYMENVEAYLESMAIFQEILADGVYYDFLFTTDKGEEIFRAIDRDHEEWDETIQSGAELVELAAEFMMEAMLEMQEACGA